MVVTTFDQKTVPRSRCGRLSGLFWPTWTRARKSLFVLISADLSVTFLDIGDLKLSFGLFGSKLRRTPERKKFLSGSGNHCLAASAGQSGSGNHSGPLSRALFLRELLLVLSVRSLRSAPKCQGSVCGDCLSPRISVSFVPVSVPRFMSGRARVVAFVGML